MISIQSLAILRYLYEGFRLIGQPGIRPYVIIPLVINLCIFVCFYSFAIIYFKGVINGFEHSLPSGLQWLKKLLWIIFALAILWISSYVFTWVANIIAAPFNALLAEQVEVKLTGKARQISGHYLSMIKDVPRSIARQLRYLAYFLPRALFIFGLFIIPGGQWLAAPLWFIFSGWNLALQYLDYPMDNHGIGFSQMKKQLSQHRSLSLAFGITVALLTMVPVVNLLVMPAATAAATRLWLERFKPTQP